MTEPEPVNPCAEGAAFCGQHGNTCPTQPEPYTYTDPSDDTLTIGRINNVVSLLAHQGNDTTEIHVLPADVEQVVAAIRTAAGQDQPTTDRTALRDRITTAIGKWHRDPEQPLYEQGADAVLAVLPEPAAPAGQDQPHDRRARWEAVAREKFANTPGVWDSLTDAYMAVADTEQQDLRVRAEQLADLLRVAEQTSNRSEAERARAVQRAEAMERGMQSTATDALKHRGCHRDLMAQCLRAERAEAERDRLRAELAQARSATTPVYVWQVWQDDQPTHTLYATEDDARQGSIDCWQETEPSCPDYGWAADGPRLELLVGGERGGVYISRQTVYGDSYVTARSAVLTEAIAAVEDPARRSGLGWESARDVLRRMAAEAQQAGHPQPEDEEPTP